MASVLLFSAVLLATVCCVSCDCSYYNYVYIGTSYKYCINNHGACCGTSSSPYCCDISEIVSISTGAIVGIVIGCIVGAVIFITICVCICRVCCCPSNGSQTGQVVTSGQAPGVAFIQTTQQNVQMQHPPPGQAYPPQGHQYPPPGQQYHQGQVNKGFVPQNPPPQNYQPPPYMKQ